MNSTSNVDAALLAPRAPAKSGIVEDLRFPSEPVSDFLPRKSIGRFPGPLPAAGPPPDRRLAGPAEDLAIELGEPAGVVGPGEAAGAGDAGIAAGLAGGGVAEG